MWTKRGKPRPSFYETQMQNNLRFMTQMLKEDHTQEGSYTGPRRFTDGAVVELDGEKVIWPEDMPTDFPKLSADQIRQGDRYQAVIGGENGEGTKVIITPAEGRGERVLCGLDRGKGDSGRPVFGAEE